MKLELPVYEFIIDDSLQSGVKTISLVEDPAIQSFFIAFDNDKPKPRYVKLKSEYEQSILGIALQPDLPIYRIDRETEEEYYGVFSVDTIKKIVHKFHKELQNNKVNLDHNSENYIDAYMFSDYIVDSELQIEDLKAKGITDARIGSWITAYKIEDPEVFNKVLDGEFKGLSVEAYLEVFSKKVKNNVLNKKVKSEMKKNNKSLKEKILSIFAEIEKFERQLVPELAFEIEWTVVGEPVNKVVVSENGDETLQPVGQGEFNTEEGIIVVDEASNLVEIRDLPADPAEELPEVSESEATSEITEATEVVAEDEILVVSGDTATVTGDTSNVIPPFAKGVDMTIANLVDLTKNGFYMIDVFVENGQIVNATLTSQQNLLSKQAEIDALKLSVVELEEKMKEPIGDPILEPEKPVVDFNKLSAYEKLMYKKGLTAVK